MKKFLFILSLTLTQVSCNPEQYIYNLNSPRIIAVPIIPNYPEYYRAKTSNDNKSIAFIYQYREKCLNKYVPLLFTINTDGSNLKLLKDLSLNSLYSTSPNRIAQDVSYMDLFWNENSTQIYIKYTNRESLKYQIISLEEKDIELPNDLNEIRLLDPGVKFEIVEDKNNPDKKQLIFSDNRDKIEPKDIRVDLSFLGLENYSNLKVQLLENRKVYITKIPDFSAAKKDPFLFYAIGDLNFDTGKINNVEVFKKSYQESPFYLEVLRYINNKLYYLFDRKIYEYNPITKKEILLGEENNLKEIKSEYNLIKDNSNSILVYNMNSRDGLLSPIISKLDLPKYNDTEKCSESKK